ncbi:MAG: HTTM domain-containing protein [Myxococcota bacterium]
MIARLEAYVAAERSTRSLGILRILVVFLLWSRWSNELQPFTAFEGGFSPGWLALGAAFYTTTTWMLLGWHTRLATTATAIVIGVMVYGVGRSGAMFAWTHHHTTLLALSVMFLAFTPCGASLSVDRWLAVRDARHRGVPPPPERGSTWALGLLALQVSTIYFWGAVDKTNLPFLSGDRLEQIAIHVYGGSDWAPPGWFHPLMSIGAIGATVLEYVLVVGLWIPSWRRWLAPIGIVLHAAFYLLLPQVNTFSCTMIALYLSFYDPDDVERFLDGLLGHPTG